MVITETNEALKMAYKIKQKLLFTYGGNTHELAVVFESDSPVIFMDDEGFTGEYVTVLDLHKLAPLVMELDELDNEDDIDYSFFDELICYGLNEGRRNFYDYSDSGYTFEVVGLNFSSKNV